MSFVWKNRARITITLACSLIDEGGMGQVYRARDLALPRDVAIKVVSPEFTDDAARRQRFRKEAEILAGFAHPHIAHVYAFVEAEGRFLLAMEIVPGETLAERIARGRLRVGEALGIARQVADALAPEGALPDPGVAVRRGLQRLALCRIQGGRFLVIRSSDEPVRIEINWTAGLKR